MDRKQRIYDFIKAFWFHIRLFVEVPPNDDEKAWDDLLEQASALNKKHGTDDAEGRFFKKCIMAWLEYLSDRDKERRAA